jgi:ribonuclease-3
MAVGEKFAMEIFGYRFKNPALLNTALTTPSRKMDDPSAKDNQRLEFLGDAVLGMLSAERVYHAFPGVKEGALTVKRTHMVSSAALCAAAARCGFGSMLRQNRAAGELPPNSKTIADAVEAVIGAAYLDGGYEAARTVFQALELESAAASGDWVANPKGELQIRTQAMVPPRRPEYVLVKTSGMAHKPTFTVKVVVDGCGEATAEAGTRKEAETLAAGIMLKALFADGGGEVRG